MQGQKNSKGFTLLEVLVAVLLIALVVTVVFEMYYRGFRGIERSESTLQAVILADSLLEEVLSHRVYDSVEGERPENFSLFAEINQIEDSPLAVINVVIRYRQRQKIKLSSGGLFYEEQ